MTADDTMWRAPGRKNTRAWCKGKVGRAHKPVIARSNYAGTWPCHPRHGWRHCWHIEQCTVCGKTLRHLTPDECPEGLPSNLLPLSSVGES